MFTAETSHFETPVVGRQFTLLPISDIEINGEWVNAKNLKVGMQIEDSIIIQIREHAGELTIYLDK